MFIIETGERRSSFSLYGVICFIITNGINFTAKRNMFDTIMYETFQLIATGVRKDGYFFVVFLSFFFNKVIIVRSICSI